MKDLQIFKSYDIATQHTTYLVGCYAEAAGKTIITESIIDSKDQPVSDEIIGWYCGEPREDLLKKYGNGDIKANYMDDGGYSHTPAEEDGRQKAAREFKEYLESLVEAAAKEDTEAAREALYEEYFVVGFKGRFVQLFFDAISFDAICSALDAIHDQE